MSVKHQILQANLIKHEFQKLMLIYRNAEL